MNLEPFNEEQSHTFEKLTDAVINPLIIPLLKKGWSFFVDTDTNNYQEGAALFQTYPGGERKQLRSWFRSSNSPKKNYCTSKKECLAAVWEL